MTKCDMCSETKDRTLYTCPKCNIVYCSVKCYQSPDHQDCSEAFYKDCVQQELTATGRLKDKNDIHEILQRQNDELLDSDDDEDDICERFEGVDLEDSDLVWSRLTESEKAEFESLVKSGEISKLVPEFKPFWSTRSSDKKVVDVQEEDQFAESVKAKVEPAIRRMSKRCGNVTITAANEVKFGLINSLCAYTHCQKLYRGQVQDDDIKEAVDLCISVSDNINPEINRNFNSADLAIESAVFNLKGQDTAKAIKKDIFQILRGPGIPHLVNDNVYILAALSEFSNIFERFLEVNKKAKDEETKKLKKQCKLIIKKLEFYFMWTQSHYTPLCFSHAQNE